MPTSYWAHSDPNGLPPHDPAARWQRLNDHLVATGELARQLAESTRPGDLRFAATARAVGLLHDIGKYQHAFQEYLLGRGRGAPHSIHGAVIACDRWRAEEAGYAIAGHHAGLPHPSAGRGSMKSRLLEARSAIEPLWSAATADCPQLADCEIPPDDGADGADLRTRMLFSCLVDADRLNSSGLTTYTPREITDANAMLAAVLTKIAEKTSRVDDGPVKEARRQVLDACLQAAGHPARLLSLTVPTGGGKTLASLAFALRRAALHPDRPRRVVVVIPFLSIIEQNAGVFADALGPFVVLEHHSGELQRLRIHPEKRVFVPVDTEEIHDAQPPYREGLENWDAPVIVTTAVRFFETLFSNRPADLRRAHNLARSIIILDEVQTVPRKYLEPILSILRDLAENWSSTVVCCTATQPAFEKRTAFDARDPRWEPGTIHEIVPDPVSLSRPLRRVEVEWPARQPLAWKDVAERMNRARRSLCIVNLRNHARLLYEELQRVADRDVIFHLSTRMCAVDRLRVLRAIHDRLKVPNATCLVAATQLVEAGVDLDFPVVFRALGPLDSIIQAAGRCDREGGITAALGRPGGRVVVFKTEDGKGPPGIYAEATELTELMLKDEAIDLYDAEVLTNYFQRLYVREETGRNIEIARRGLQFPKVAEEFDYIADHTENVLIPFDDEAHRLIVRLTDNGAFEPATRRGLQRYMVGLRPDEFRSAQIAALRKIPLFRTTDKQEAWVCREGFYKAGIGLRLQPDSQDYVL
jgi:CRISPR-associated endonuclease/helicase Cas3